MKHNLENQRFEEAQPRAVSSDADVYQYASDYFGISSVKSAV
jgi:hypothetical protein